MCIFLIACSNSGGGGGDGEDTLSYENASSGVFAKLGDRQYRNGDAAGDDAEGFENLIGSNHDDSDLFGSSGRNKVLGRDGNDGICGLNDRDDLYREGGNDRIDGDEGDDLLVGGIGDDDLIGDAGADTIVGGAGDDFFVAHSADGNTDTITDFTSGDKIRVDVVDPSSINNLASLFGTLGIGQATSSSGVTLTFDRRASGSNASDYLIVLDGFTTSLTFTDFEVI